MQDKPAHTQQFSTEQTCAIVSDVAELLKKGVIREANHPGGEYISPLCVLPVKDNRWRMILNLKELNKE